MWHDLECGGYAEDLPLWLELAGDGPVLDVGAGTGRSTLFLARRGIAVTALDLVPELLDTLRERAAGLPVEAVAADMRDFDLGRTFPVVLVPMQTIQLLGGPDDRAAFLRCAHAHLDDDGILACALADAREGISDDPDAELPLPDMRDLDGVVWASRPLAIRDEGGSAVILRLREVVTREGHRSAQHNEVRLQHLHPALLEAECVDAGFRVLERRRIAETDEHVGSDVVVVAR